MYPGSVLDTLLSLLYIYIYVYIYISIYIYIYINFISQSMITDLLLTQF